MPPPNNSTTCTRGFQSVVDGAGPRSEEAKGFANNVPVAIREVRRLAGRRTNALEAAYQQIVTKYQQASSAGDKSSLEAARNAFQSIAQSGGPHASEAQKFVEDINTKLTALSQPAPPTATPVKPEAKPEASSAAADNDAVLLLVKRYSQAFEQRNPNALQQIWPTMGKLYAGYKNSFEKASSIRMQVQTESVKIAADGNTAIAVTGQFTGRNTLHEGQKPRSVKGRTVFQFAKVEWRLGHHQRPVSPDLQPGNPHNGLTKMRDCSGYTRPILQSGDMKRLFRSLSSGQPGLTQPL